MPIGETNPFRIIGAFAPSSRRLAHAMTRFVGEREGRILEVGAGSGAITKAMVKKMHVQETADVVEILPQMTQLLQLRFGKHAGVKIIGGDILHFDVQPNSYDVIICSLPFNSFRPDTTRAILQRLFDLAKDCAIMSFFEYRVLQGVAKCILPKKKREEFLASHRLIELFNQHYKFDETLVNMNIPPAVVHYLRIDKTKAFLKHEGEI